MSWPTCESRKDAQSDGFSFIEAAPVGLIKTWSTNKLPMSTFTRKRPDLAKILTRFIEHDRPKDGMLYFPYTTIQLNRNHSAKLHVDGNNHGPSHIIGLWGVRRWPLMALEYEQKAKVQIGLSTCCARRGPGVLFALQELFSQATLQA